MKVVKNRIEKRKKKIHGKRKRNKRENEKRRKGKWGGSKM